MKCSDFDQETEIMLRQKKVHLNFEMRNHLNVCETCWNKLVSIRWQIAKDTIELKELRDFLGKDFLYGCDSSWGLANDWNSKKRESGSKPPDTPDFSSARNHGN